MGMSEADGLERLEASLARDFERLNHPPADWVPPRTGPDGRRMVDVAIVGGRHVRAGGGVRPPPARGLAPAAGGPAPRGAGRAVADVRPHGDPALAQAPRGAGAGVRRAHVPGVVGGPGARLGGARPDPPDGVGGLPRLVPPRDRGEGRERGRGDLPRTGCERGPGAARRGGRGRRGGDGPRPPGRARDRAGRAGGAPRPGAAGPLSGAGGAGSPRLRRHRLRGPRGPAGGGGGARRDRLRQRRRRPGGGARRRCS